MGRIGRILFVSVPMALTIASLICLLICTVPNNSRYLIKVDTQNMSVSAADIESDLENILRKRTPTPVENIVKMDLSSDLSSDYDAAASYVSSALASAETGGASAISSAVSSLETSSSTASSAASLVSDIADGSNITAADLGLADYYTLTLWNYCAETDGSSNCSKAEFNFVLKTWDNSTFNQTAASLGVTIPDSFDDAVKVYGELTKWTEIVYIIALVATAVEIVFGLIALCSKFGGCCTWLIAGIANLFVIAASIMATVMASISVGAIDSAGKAYGLDASINTSFLATTWLAVAFNLLASLFWMFSACCCSSTSSRKSNKYGEYNRNGSNEDMEKLAPAPVGGYQRVHEPVYASGARDGEQTGIYDPQPTYGHSQPQFAMPGSNYKNKNHTGYEPYSHTAI